jgi:hypothetical protein
VREMARLYKIIYARGNKDVTRSSSQQKWLRMAMNFNTDTPAHREETTHLKKH